MTDLCRVSIETAQHHSKMERDEKVWREKMTQAWQDIIDGRHDATLLDSIDPKDAILVAIYYCYSGERKRNDLQREGYDVFIPTPSIAIKEIYTHCEALAEQIAERSRS